MNRGELIRRYLFFTAGLFVNALGVSLITKASLGTSPITSIPYVLDIGFAPTLGMFTLVFNLLLVALQLGILRRRFPRHFWLEIPVTLGFSCFIDLTMSMLTAYSPQGYPLQLLSLLFGCLVLGFGVCSLGLQNGVEKITKAMMVCLLLLMVALAVRSVEKQGA